MIYTILVSLLAGVTLVALVALSITRESALAPLFQYLIWLGLGGVVALLGVSLFQLWRMLRRGVFRSTLTRRLFWVMVSVAVVPGAGIYAVSLGFIKNTVDSWFSGPMRNLEGGRALAESTLRQVEEDQVKRGRNLAEALRELPAFQRMLQLEQMRQQMGLNEVALFERDSRRELSRAPVDLSTLAPMALDDTIPLSQIRVGEPWRERRPLENGGIELRQIFLLPSLNPHNPSEKAHYLLVLYPLPQEMTRLIQGVHAAAEVYQQQAYARPGLERLLLIGLTLALALALFAAILLASFFADRMAAPLRALVQGVRSVARGNLVPLALTEHRDDELGQLTQAYNRMTQQLQDREARLKQSHQYLVALLESVNTAVLTLDSQLCIRMINRKATELLGFEREALTGLALEAVGTPEGSINRFARACALHIREAGAQSWREQVELMRADGRRLLQVHGTAIAHDGEAAQMEYALVFEDVTQLASAQKSAAWGEVARRLAHEVKNPLTPIQLSVERLQYRLADRLDESGRKLLNSASETVLQQVAAMKDLVNAFAQYAKSPEPVLRPLDMNELVREVGELYSGQTALTVELAAGLPPVNADRTLMNRVLVNLIKNAMEATAAGTAQPAIVIRTQINPDGVCVCVEDNGPGFSEEQMSRLFQPYATTKPKGSGLGMPIVKQVVEAHHGGIEVYNREPHGAAIRITLPALPQDKEETA